MFDLRGRYVSFEKERGGEVASMKVYRVESIAVCRGVCVDVIIEHP
jgi:hypothetical protein